MWLEQLSKLLEKLAVAREVTGRIFRCISSNRARARSSVSLPVRVSGVPTAADFGAGAPTRRRSASVSVPAHSIFR